jgi:hypothetical protein
MQTASPVTQQRFIETFDFYFQAVTKQALDRESDEIPDLESYIALRRDSSGCKLCFTFIEYANNLDIPDDVMDHPLLRSLVEAANDLVSWANVSPGILWCTFCLTSSFRICTLTTSSSRMVTIITWS